MNFELDAYAGPLDLLLGLIEKNEIDLSDIPMSELCRQYLEAIRGMPPDMDGMSEFLVMAATLLEIKSRMLLPRPPRFGEDEEEDPREALVRQLIAYKYCQSLAEVLKNTDGAGLRIFKEPEYPLMEKTVIHNRPEDWLADVTMSGLWELFNDVMQRQASKVDTVRRNFGTVPRERHTVSEKIAHIAGFLKKAGQLRLSELFEKCRSRGECVVTFLALLEMVKLRQVSVRQDEVFSDVEVCLL